MGAIFGALLKFLEEIGIKRFAVGEGIWNFTKDKRGVTAIEYGLIAALIAMAIVAAVGLVGTDLTEVFSSVAGSL